jgi:hypothetical protein
MSAKTGGDGLATDYLQLLKAIPALSQIVGPLTADDINRYPSIPIAGVLDDPATLEAFLAAVDAVSASAAPSSL